MTLKKRTSIFSSVLWCLLLFCVVLLSCEKQETDNSEGPSKVTPRVQGEYEYAENGLPTKFTLITDGEISYIYEYVYDDDGVLEKRIEKDADGNLEYEREYSNGETVKYETVYSDDGIIESKLEYDDDGNLIQRINYNDHGVQSIEINYDTVGEITGKTEYRYLEGVNLYEVIKSDKDGVTEEIKYNREGNITSKYEYSIDAYGGNKLTKHTEYDTEGNVQSVNHSYYHQQSESEQIASMTAYGADGVPTHHIIYDDSGSGGRVQWYIEYDGLGITSLMKGYNEHGMVHYVVYESGKTVSWTEYKYDENGRLTEKIKHDVEGKRAFRKGLGTDIGVVDVVDTEYEYVNDEDWEYSDNISAKRYFYSSNLSFEEGDTVPADKLIRYFTMFEMLDENSGFEFKEYLKQYVTDRVEYLGNLCIPKEIVNSEIEKHFAVKIDGSDSEYTDPENEDCYILFSYAKDRLSVAMKNYTVDGNRSTAVYALYSSIDGSIDRKAEICIENEDSEEDFKIIYVREIE